MLNSRIISFSRTQSTHKLWCDAINVHQMKIRAISKVDLGRILCYNKCMNFDFSVTPAGIRHVAWHFSLDLLRRLEFNFGVFSIKFGVDFNSTRFDSNKCERGWIEVKTPHFRVEMKEEMDEMQEERSWSERWKLNWLRWMGEAEHTWSWAQRSWQLRADVAAMSRVDDWCKHPLHKFHHLELMS